jgi:hypothetical protein
LAADLVMFAAGTQESLIDSSMEWVFLFAGMMLMFLADLYALAWVGIWLGLVSRRANRALSGTIVRVLVLPWAIYTFGLTALAMLRWRTLEPPSEFAFIAGGLTLSFINDAFWYAWAKGNLRQRFRLMATHAFDAAGKNSASNSAAADSSSALPALAQ